ncbi:MAG: hypothetical protein AB1391_04110 [Candidatus Micrarchaeota archaeon]
MNFKERLEEFVKLDSGIVQIFILIVTFTFYLITKDAPQYRHIAPIFGILVAVEFIVFVALEIKKGAEKHGIKNEILDIAKSLGVVLLIWLFISIILRTSVPISAVVSCSMLPNLQRGDLAIIRGVSASEITASEINVSLDEFKKIITPKTRVYSPYKNFTVNGSIFSYCQAYKNHDSVCEDFIREPERFVEQRGPLIFTYSKCKRKTLNADTFEEQQCVISILHNGKMYKTNLSNSIVVYQPNNGDLFSYTGDIIHRVYLKINVDGQEYFLTKGDNNNIFDMQFFDYRRQLANTPFQEKNIKGATIFTIPYIGYFKLFLSGFVEETFYCNTNLFFSRSEL